MYKTLLYEAKDGIATITLNRPEANNAFSREAFQETGQVLEQCSLDESVRVVIVTGKGKHFSVGGYVQAMATDETYITYETAKLTSARNTEGRFFCAFYSLLITPRLTPVSLSICRRDSPFLLNSFISLFLCSLSKLCTLLMLSISAVFLIISAASKSLILNVSS